MWLLCKGGFVRCTCTFHLGGASCCGPRAGTAYADHRTHIQCLSKLLNGYGHPMAGDDIIGHRRAHCAEAVSHFSPGLVTGPALDSGFLAPLSDPATHSSSHSTWSTRSGGYGQNGCMRAVPPHVRCLRKAHNKLDQANQQWGPLQGCHYTL